MKSVPKVLNKRNIVPIGTSIIEIVIAAATKIREPRRKADHEPLFQVERLKQDFFRHFKRFAKWLEYFDIAFAVHAAI